MSGSAAGYQATLPAPPAPHLEAALDYCRWVTQKDAENRGKELLKGALDRGDALLEVTGHWLPAVEALRYAWEVELSAGHTAGILDPAWEAKIQAGLLQYLRRQVVEGARVRQGPGGGRVKAKAHSTARDNPDAILDKIWRKGVVKGRKLIVRSKRKELEFQSEDKPGVESCPNGAVQKLNPDRTVSEEVRVIWDLRLNNAGGARSQPPPPP